MKRLLLIGAAALVVGSLMPEDASAQRGRGMSAARIGGGPAIAGGYRGVGIARGGYAIRGAGLGVRTGVWRGRGWGLPVAAGLAAAGAWAYSGYPSSYGYGYSSYGYSDQCLAWNGYGWVSVCRPYDYNYGNNSMW